jgi:hypothetical protein
VATTSDSRGRRARLRFRTLSRWLKYFESAPITQDEFLLRAIPNTPNHISEDMGNWKIAPYAFQPRPCDVDGLSFFREDFSKPKKVAKANRHTLGARVSRIMARQFADLGLSITPNPIKTEPAGHAIVPQMRFLGNSPQSRDERRLVKDLSQKLAQFASNNPIYSPSGLPNPLR